MIKVQRLGAALPVAVETCIEAAAHQFDHAQQRDLLRVCPAPPASLGLPRSLGTLMFVTGSGVWEVPVRLLRRAEVRGHVPHAAGPERRAGLPSGDAADPRPVCFSILVIEFVHFVHEFVNFGD